MVTRIGDSEEKNRWSALLFGVNPAFADRLRRENPSDHDWLFVVTYIDYIDFFMVSMEYF
jgi:hypothetical protein